MKTHARIGVIVPILLTTISACVLTACNNPGTAVSKLPYSGILESERYNLQTVDSGLESRVTGENTWGDMLFASGPEPDLIVESITWSPQNPSKGDTITISANIKNQGDAQSMTSTVSLYVDGYFKDEKFLNNMGAGETVIKEFTWIIQQGSSVFKIVVDKGGTVEERDETNNEKSVTISSLNPDLTIQSINWQPTGPVAGDNATFYFTIKNQGEGSAVSSFGYFYMDDERQCTVTFNALAPGQVYTETLSWPVKAGVYTVRLEIDPNNIILESDETNNEKTVDFATILPDLVVNSITWLPVTPTVGETVNFTITVGNQGRAVSASSNFHFYISDVTSLTGTVKNIAVGGTDTIKVNWVALPGQHKIRIVLDPYNYVNEILENNNEITMGNILSVRSADLSIDSVTWSPEEASPGDTLTLSVLVRNRGFGEAASTLLRYYVDGVQADSSVVDALSYGGVQVVTFTWVVEEGSHTFRFVADSSHVVFEDNEDNNESIVAYPVPPDLTIKSITLSPSEPVEGDDVTFTINIENVGGVGAEHSSVAFYIDDVYIDYLSGGPVASEGSANMSFVWTAVLGGHNCKAIIDPFNNVIETNEENNEKAESFLVAEKVESEPDEGETTVPGTGEGEATAGLPGDSSNASEDTQNSLWFFSLLGGGIIILVSYLFFEYRRRQS